MSDQNFSKVATKALFGVSVVNVFGSGWLVSRFTIGESFNGTPFSKSGVQGSPVSIQGCSLLSKNYCNSTIGEEEV
jgi:hypothetical protein